MVHTPQHPPSPVVRPEIITFRRQAGLVGWGLTALLTQNRSYRACKFVGIFHSKL